MLCYADDANVMIIDLLNEGQNWGMTMCLISSMTIM